MTHTTTHHDCSAPVRHARTPFLNMLLLAFTAAKHRKQLTELDSHLRDDLGLSDADIHHESKRRFWDVPAHWLQ